jgi:phage terminase large subunit
MHRIEDGINGVRVTLPRCWFDAAKCARGIDALKLYRAATDDKLADPQGRPMLKPAPVHDWTSHAADAFRYLAMTLDGLALRTGYTRKIDYPRLGIA